jgi:uncharacterized protein (DUF427 family)
MKATWNGEVIAESTDTIEIEGNQYFPADSVHKEFLEPSDHTSTCVWKGLAHYYTVVVNGQRNENAAWYYPVPKEGSVERVGKDFSNYVAFWNGVEVST